MAGETGSRSTIRLSGREISMLFLVFHIIYASLYRSLVIFGQEMEPCEKSRDSTACAYSSYYNTNGLKPSKKGQRQDLIIVMKVHFDTSVSRDNIPSKNLFQQSSKDRHSTVFWNITTYSLVGIYRNFKRAYRFHNRSNK